jgi:intermembrane space import and assembly protein 40
VFIWINSKRCSDTFVASKKLPVSTTPSLPAADSPPPPIQTEETSSETSVPVIEEDTDKTPQAAPVENPSEEQPSGGAYNPVTGEINWDCPCLGGMAHGPCGPEFREAFSCFVYSEKEPKGIDCVEKFKAMQTCFREHPDVYGDGKLVFLLGSLLCSFRCRNYG